MKQQRAFGLLLLVTLLVVGACGVWLRVQKRQYAHNRALIAALVHNDTRTALALVNAGADPNTRFDPPPAPTFKLLLAHLLHHKGLPVNNSPTALIMVCGEDWTYSPYGSLEALHLPNSASLIEAMIAHGADVNAKTIAGDTALEAAIYLRNAHVVEILLTHGAYVNGRNCVSYTCLMNAARIGCKDEVHSLLTHGAEVNAQDNFGRTALHQAVLTRFAADVIRELLKHGADANITDKRQMTALMMAQQYSRFDIVNLLRRAGTNAPPTANHR